MGPALQTTGLRYNTWSRWPTLILHRQSRRRPGAPSLCLWCLPTRGPWHGLLRPPPPFPAAGADHRSTKPLETGRWFHGLSQEAAWRGGGGLNRTAIPLFTSPCPSLLHFGTRAAMIPRYTRCVAGGARACSAAGQAPARGGKGPWGEPRAQIKSHQNIVVALQRTVCLGVLSRVSQTRGQCKKNKAATLRGV